MKVGIHTDPDRGFRKDLERYEKILAFNGIGHERMDANRPDFWERVADLDLFIFHWGGTARQHRMAPAILRIVEREIGIPCYPDEKTWWVYDDKVREHYLLSRHGFPVIPTRVFWDREPALAWLREAVYPLIFKLRSGGSSLNVLMVRGEADAAGLVDRMFGRGVTSERLPGSGSVQWSDSTLPGLLRRFGRDSLRRLRGLPISPYEDVHRNYVLFQKFLPGNAFDTRITVIGDRAFASRRHVRAGDFRSSGSGNDDWTQEAIDHRCLDIAFAISDRCGFQCMSYDFLYDEERRPLVSEMSYTSPDWTVWKCPGYWDRSHGWHEGHYWPQYVNLRRLLGNDDLRQPDIEPG